MTEEEFDQYIMHESYESMWKYEEEIRAKNESYKPMLKGLVNVKRLYEWLDDEQTGWRALGIVEIEPTDKKMNGYPNHECCYVKEKHTMFMKCSGEDTPFKYYYVWQITGYLGDDYSGELLLPLKDGRYFQIAFSC